MSFKDISKVQRAVILRFMVNHKELVKNEKNKGGKFIQASNKNLWQILSTTLNYDINGKIFTSDLWEKVWKDWKADVKSKHSKEKKNLTATGGGPATKETRKVKQIEKQLNTSESDSSDSDDLIIVEDAKLADAQPELSHGNKLQVTHDESTLQPGLKFIKRKASSNNEMTVYQKCKLKILNDNLKVNQRILQNLQETNQRKTDLLKHISQNLAELK